MDNTELHYVTYDADAIMTDMLTSYMEAGGEIIYAGDEKEILLQAVLQILMQAFARVDNALRMDSLRYAQRGYLDIYGEKRSCYRIPAKAATAKVRITMEATGVAGEIPAGTALTADGSALYLIPETIATGGYAQELETTVECSQNGSIGNALILGAELQSLSPIDGAVSIICIESATGGQDEESDEDYRERIRTYGLTSVSTGPRQQYEAVAKEVSTEILDARAMNLGAGEVGVYLIFASDTGKAALISAVEEALNDDSARPLTDQVTVAEATAVSYTLNVKYSYDGSVSAQTEIAAAVSEWKKWQEQTIGRAFNPDRLKALMYQAGATRVVWGTGSEFNDGDVEYTEIDPDEYCHGTITTAVIDD